VGENFGGVGTAKKLAEITLAGVYYLVELMRPHNFLADKTLADWQ